MNPYRQMTHIPAIKSMMTPFPYSVSAAAPLSDAAAMMRKHRIRHLPVMESGKLVGVLSDREMALASAAAVPGEEPLVGNTLLGEGYVVDLEEDLDNVLQEMAQRHVGSAIVVRDGKLAGIFTVTDACSRFCEFLRGWFPRGDDGKAA